MQNEIPIEFMPSEWTQCHNTGPCCFTCPHFDECDNREDLED